MEIGLLALLVLYLILSLFVMLLDRNISHNEIKITELSEKIKNLEHRTDTLELEKVYDVVNELRRTKGL